MPFRSLTYRSTRLLTRGVEDQGPTGDVHPGNCRSNTCACQIVIEGTAETVKISKGETLMAQLAIHMGFYENLYNVYICIVGIIINKVTYI